MKAHGVSLTLPDDKDDEGGARDSHWGEKPMDDGVVLVINRHLDKGDGTRFGVGPNIETCLNRAPGSSGSIESVHLGPLPLPK